MRWVLERRSQADDQLAANQGKDTLVLGVGQLEPLPQPLLGALAQLAAILGQPAGDGGAVDFVEGADPADVQTIRVVEPQAEALAARERRERSLEGLFARGAILQLVLLRIRARHGFSAAGTTSVLCASRRRAASFPRSPRRRRSANHALP
jgi:hypothetical protein